MRWGKIWCEDEVPHFILYEVWGEVPHCVFCEEWGEVPHEIYEGSIVWEIHYSISEILPMPTYLYGFGFCECVIGIIDSLFHFLPNLFLKEYINLKGRNAKVLSIWVSKNDYIPEVVFCKNSQKFCWIRGTEKLFHATGHFTKCAPMVPNLYT